LRPFRLLLTCALMLGALSLVILPPRAMFAEDASRGRFFEQTGQVVQGTFHSFWEQRGGLAIFGYPISKEFMQDGRSTQYFERAVLQSFPEHAQHGHSVQLMLLGRLLTADRQGEAPFQPLPAGARERDASYFEQTQHSIKGVFRNYWHNNGGLAVFGYPISEEFDETNPVDGKRYRVQYFERARFEHHPEHRGTRHEVQLGHLGTQYAAMRTLPSDVTERQPGPGAPFPPKGQVTVSRSTPVVVNDSFISPLVELFGNVSVGKGVFIASNTILRADPDTQICIGNQTNLQDNIILVVHRNSPAPNAACGPHSSSTQERVSIAHQAQIKNSRIGNFTFIGFRASLENVILEDGAFVLHGATIRNVTIGKDRLVPVGAVITTQAQADALPLKTDAQSQFQEEVLEVNAEFAEHYPDLYEQGGIDAVQGIGPAPKTSFNNGASPTLGQNVTTKEFARIVGDVRIGSNSVIGSRTSIRADEGAPIIIGDNAHIEDRVTFHALKGTSIRIGANLRTEDNIVFHGPLEVGDNLTIGDDSILFRSKVGNNVTIGTGAIVIDVTLRDGVTVPENAQITSQAQADQLK
jgi:carbon dioxide concentrating mechanism protein CcmM